MSAMLIVMDLSRPWAPIRSPIDMDVVRILRRTKRPLTGREVARLSPSRSRPAVNAALRRLAEEGVLRAEEAGNAYLYTLNREHLAAPALELLANIPAELERRMRAEIGDWEIAPKHISIFGSAARGGGDTRSDIDLFVVRPTQVSGDDARWQDQLGRLSDRVYAWTGNHTGLSEVSAADVPRLKRERPPVVDELRQDAITLAGPSVSELF